MKQTTPTFKDIANRWLTEMACVVTPVPGDSGPSFFSLSF